MQAVGVPARADMRLGFVQGTRGMVDGNREDSVDEEAAARRRRLLVFAGVSASAIFDAWLWLLMPQWQPGTDLLAAWSVNLADPWAGSESSMVGAGLFRHSPVVAQVASLFGAIPWLPAQLLFLALQLAVIYAMAGPRWPYVVLFPGVFWNLYFGNVDLLMGAAIYAGFRYPGVWAVLFLTKLTPGIGVLWFAFRREWRALGIALGTTLAVVAVSFALSPGLWFRWADALLDMSRLPQSVTYPPLVVRLPLALGIVFVAARTDRRWLLPVACLVAVPNPWFVTFAVLGASVALIPVVGWLGRSHEPVDDGRARGVALGSNTNGVVVPLVGDVQPRTLGCAFVVELVHRFRGPLAR